MARRATRGVLAAVLLGGALAVAACAPGPEPEGGGARPAARADVAPRPGTSVVALDFLEAFENTPAAPYYPFGSLAGCAYTDDGMLLVCDEDRGKLHGFDPVRRRWHEFDAPAARPYRPIDAVVDGFKVLVLDRGGYDIWRFDLHGAFLDRLLDVRTVDPAVRTDPAGFAIDRDGRMVISDVAQQQVLLLDAFLAPTVRMGEPGALADQFSDPSGVVFLPDGRIVVADRGNRRLSVYDRLGFFEFTVGGDIDAANPFAAPQGLACDRHGNLFVADRGNGLIHVLDRRLRSAFSVGPEVEREGVPLSPLDAAVGPDRTLAVTDRGRNAVLVYRIVYE